MPSKFITGELILDGVRLPNVVEFTPVKMEWEDLNFDNLGSKVELYNDYKLKELAGTIKISGPMTAPQMSKLYNSKSVVELMSTNLYSEADELSLDVEEVGHYEMYRVVFGGVAGASRTNGEGGDFEVPYKMLSKTILDRYNQETFFYDVRSNALRLDGIDQRTEANRILGKS